MTMSLCTPKTYCNHRKPRQNASDDGRNYTLITLLHCRAEPSSSSQEHEKVTGSCLAGSSECEDGGLEAPARLQHLSCCSSFGTRSKLAAHARSSLTHSLPAMVSRCILVPHAASLFLYLIFEDNLEGNMHLTV